MESYASIFKVIRRIKPDEVYHLAAQSFVSYSFEDEFSTMNININGTHFVLSALRELCPESRFYFAGSSEMFGRVRETPQNEATPFHPRSAYGISKVAGRFWMKKWLTSRMKRLMIIVRRRSYTWTKPCGRPIV